MSRFKPSDQPKRPRAGRHHNCPACDLRIASETLKIPEFASKMLLDEQGELILCADCVKSGMYGGLPEDYAAPPPKKSKVEGKEKPSASSSSSSSSSLATGGERKKPPASGSSKRSASRPRAANEPTRPIHSHESLLDWCISKYYDARPAGFSAVGATTTAVAAATTTSESSRRPSSSLDALVAELPAEVVALLTGKPLAHTAAPKVKSRKGSNPKKLAINAALG